MAYQRIFGDTATGGAQTTINKNAKYQPIFAGKEQPKIAATPVPSVWEKCNSKQRNFRQRQRQCQNEN